MKNKEIECYFSIVESIAKMSYCGRLRVGSILVKNNSIIAYGYNGTAHGDENVCDMDNVTLPNVIHAEMNAIYKCAKSNESAENSSLFITHSPCLSCSVAIVQTGIKEVYYINDYRDTSPIDYLKSKGITVIKREFANDTNT